MYIPIQPILYNLGTDNNYNGCVRLLLGFGAVVYTYIMYYEMKYSFGKEVRDFEIR